MPIQGMDLAWVVAKDFKKAKKFFTETLGLNIHEECTDYNWLEMQGKKGGALVGLCEACDMTPIKAGQNAVLTFTCDHLDKTRAELESKGVTFIGDVMEVPEQVKMILFQDESGNTYQLVEKLGSCKR